MLPRRAQQHIRGTMEVESLLNHNRLLKFMIMGPTVRAAGWGYRLTNKLMELWEKYIDGVKLCFAIPLQEISLLYGLQET